MRYAQGVSEYDISERTCWVWTGEQERDRLNESWE